MEADMWVKKPLSVLRLGEIGVMFERHIAV